MEGAKYNAKSITVRIDVQKHNGVTILLCETSSCSSGECELTDVYLDFLENILKY